MCTSPNYMVWRGEYTKNDKPKLDFLGHHEYRRLIEISQGFDKFPFISIPCQKCLECRIQSTRQWSDRCVMESKNSPYNYFLTLTYDDNHLPYRNSLDPNEMVSFMNRLRKYFKRKLHYDGKIRFLLSGEYGGSSWRPHYHIILFNCPIPDLSFSFYREEEGKLIRTDKPPSKFDLYFSQVIYDLWSETDPEIIKAKGKHKGMISIGHFNYDTAAYVAQYVTKKCLPGYDKGKVYEELGIYPEFIRMSNRPGIGAQYFEDNPMLHGDGKLVVPGDGGAHLSSIPRYYDKLFVKKYGEDIFNSEIGVKRTMKRFSNLDTYLHSPGKNLDRDNKLRDYKINKIHHLKNSI